MKRTYHSGAKKRQEKKKKLAEVAKSSGNLTSWLSSSSSGPPPPPQQESTSSDDETDQNPAPQFDRAVYQFSAEFYNEVVKDYPRESLSISLPLIHQLVSGLIPATTGTSHEELLRALHMPNEDFAVLGYDESNQSFVPFRDIGYLTTCKFYIRNNKSGKSPSFLKATNKMYIDVEKVDFTTKSAAYDINKWVASKMNDLFHSTVSPKLLKPDTSILGVCNLNIKATLKNVYIGPDNFHVGSTKIIERDMLHFSADLPYEYNDELDAKLLKLPILKDMFLYIAMPSGVDGLPRLVKHTTFGSTVVESANKMPSVRVNVKIPKFRIQTFVDIKEYLSKMGVTGVFDKRNTEMTGMLQCGDPLYLSAAVHECMFEIGEGTTVDKLKFDGQYDFFADRPFTYFVVSDYGPIHFGSYWG